MQSALLQNYASAQKLTFSDAAPDISNWYVAETLPRKESCAVENLARQHFHTFFPRFRKDRCHARKRDVVIVPVFPGYIFVNFNIESDHWTAINSTRGVRRLVGSRGRKPQAVNASTMGLLLRRCKNEIMVQLAPDLAPGDQVKINSGPLADLVAVVESLDERDRINLLLNILGADHSISFPIREVRPHST